MPSVERVRLAYNNVYIVSDGADVVVIDTGPDYKGARETVAKALGDRTPAIVVATHGHLDHSGLGTWWQSRSVPVALGSLDIPQASGHSDSDIDLLEEYVRLGGAPEDVQVEVIEGLEARRKYLHALRKAKAYPEARDGRWPTGLRYEPFLPDRIVEGRNELPCGLVALHSPGHTPGNLVVVHEGEGWLFSGDQLLPEITPTPAIQFVGGQRFASLPRFLDSLETLDRATPALRYCYPGHGEPFENVLEVIEENLSQAQQRSERLFEAMTAEPESVYHLAERLYPRALRRRFWQIVSTIQGHLDVLAEGKRVVASENRWYRR